jgi:uncharacterized protein (DUF427 family)
MSERADRNPKSIKIPGPDHPITIERNTHRIVIAVAGRVVADTRAALTLREASYLPVRYIARKDVDTALLERTDHATDCPYKGDCAYYSIPFERGAFGRRRLDLMPRSPRSRTTSLSIPTVWTPSRNGRAASPPRGPSKPEARQPIGQALT